MKLECESAPLLEELPHPDYHTQEPEEARFELGQFFLAALGQLAAVLAAYWLIAPGTLRSELARPWSVLGWTIGLGLPLSLFEYLYHRYLLHAAVLPFMSAMQRAHGTHHGLTDVRAAVRAKEPDRLVAVKSEYPVVEKHQEDSMKFPLWSALVFVPVLLLLIGTPIKALFPAQPILLSMIFSVMLYYCAYEIWHAVLHLPFDSFWRPRMKYGAVRRVYGFHLMHHWRPTANLAIVGFWGVAVWDHLFRTHHRPQRMPLDQALVSYVDARLPQSRWPISMFDRWQGSWQRSSRRLERFLAQKFTRREKTPR